MATTPQSTPQENKEVSNLNEGEKTLPTLAKEVIGLDAKEDSGDKLMQVKGQISALLIGVSYQASENLLFELMKELKKKAIISAS